MNPKPSLSNNTSGVVGEYRVIIDLLVQGYEIFRACSPSCSCDLAILKNGKLLRLEVTTGKYTTTGKFSTPKHVSEKYDIIATVLHDKIVYNPPLPYPYPLV